MVDLKDPPVNRCVGHLSAWHSRCQIPRPLNIISIQLEGGIPHLASDDYWLRANLRLTIRAPCPSCRQIRLRFNFL
jgi:hypothetical protein